MLILFSAYACLYCLRRLNCFYNVNYLVVVPAYTVKEVPTASTMLILFSAYACLCSAYTVKEEVSTASIMLILFSAYAYLYYQRSVNDVTQIK